MQGLIQARFKCIGLSAFQSRLTSSDWKQNSGIEVNIAAETNRMESNTHANLLSANLRHRAIVVGDVKLHYLGGGANDGVLKCKFGCGIAHLG